ncbi:MAG: alpha-L-fucosidase [Steroidobacteraceae bacterium]
MTVSRRRFVTATTLGLVASHWLPRRVLAARNASRAFQPTWESLRDYQVPEWFRDAKFGIWAHWTAQCVPEQGDWYARNMYLQGDAHYEHHLKTYGHPSQTGFMEMDNLWRAEAWDPEGLMRLYKAAGAKYFVALANHHDNFDTFDSAHHAWNSVKVGPRKDIVGGWAKAARAQGLRFGVSNHSGHAWHWLQPAYGYDGEGALAGVRYDAAKLTKEDGRGKWWEGLDPQELYTGPNIVLPDGIRGAGAVRRWHEDNDSQWVEDPPANNPVFVRKWFLRCQDLVDKYRPDLLYFDNTGLPLGQAGLDIAAHYYNASRQWHGGKVQVVINSKKLTDEQRPALVEDIERGFSDAMRALPWQTDTCIGHWHYRRSLFEEHRYTSAGTVIGRLCDIVSKNGNLLLSIPLRGDGTIDADERQILEQLASWMNLNGEAIFGTRPWRVFGEGPTEVKAGMFGEEKAKAFSGEDIRFTRKGDALYAILLGWPPSTTVTLKSLASGTPGKVERVEMLGLDTGLSFTRDVTGLVVKLPPTLPGEHAFVLRIRGQAL